MEKFSVKRPFTVLVGVIMILALGFVSVTRISTDLLPEISFPFLVVVAPYPGASPERVEFSLTDPLENTLGTITGVKSITSTSSENYAVIQMEFEEETNMDSAMVKVSSALDQLSGTLPEAAGTPTIMEISMDMLATMYVAVNREDHDIYDLSDFVRSDIVPFLERQEGVAGVTPVGLVEKSVHVELSQEKIDDLNDRILEKTNEALEDARKQLEEAQETVDEAMAELEKQEGSFGSTLSGALFGQISGTVINAANALRIQANSLIDQLNALNVAAAQARPDQTQALDNAIRQLQEAEAQLAAAQAAADSSSQETDAAVRQTEIASAAVAAAQEEVTTAQQVLAQAEQAAAQLADAETALNTAQQVLAQAQADQAAAQAQLEQAAAQAQAAAELTPEEAAARQAALDAAQQYAAQTQAALDTAGVNVQQAQAVLDAARQNAAQFPSSESALQLAAQAQAALDTVREQWDAAQSIQQTDTEQQSVSAQSLADAQAAYAEALAAVTAAQSGQGDPDAAAALEAARQQLEAAALAFSSAAGNINDTSYSDLIRSAADLADYLAQIQAALEAIRTADPGGQLITQITNVEYALSQLNAGLDGMPALLSGLQTGYAGLTQAQLQAAVGFSTATSQLTQAQAQLEAAQTQYDESRETALKNANADSLLTSATLAQLVYAQNFSMPAGYIDDKDKNAWLLRVGDEYETPDEIARILLIDSDELGAVRLADVADITVIDNADDSFAILNGSDGVILCIYKSSTAGTNDVSRTCRAAFDELEERYEGTHLVPMMDQGIYITLIIKDILHSILLGAVLAILVLALFLRALKPTMVVAISIPLSVLFALVLMYFSRLSLNIMTLSGLSLGIGMLVDNSIVVMENIFRLRSRGVPAARAAVQGARQVRGAIIASTLTTICVFLPVVFASGTVRQFLTPLALTIGYCLTASLIVALTVVPASSSSLMKSTKTKELRLFIHLQESYGRSLGWCLRHRFVTLLVAVVLLFVSVWQIMRMGIVFLPEMTSSFIEVDVTTPEDMTREESYAEVDKVVDAILQVDGVIDIGIMDQGSLNGLVSAFGGTGDTFGMYIGYLTADENAAPDEIKRICAEVETAAAGLNCTVKAASSGMDDLSGFTSSAGLSLNVYGQDLDTIREITADVKEIVESQEGYINVHDGTENGAPTLQLHIDRDKATSYGLTTAQIYQQIAARVETSVTSTTITVDDLEMDVTIYDPTDPLTKENLLDMEFSTENAGHTQAMQGSSSMMGGSSMMAGASAGSSPGVGSSGSSGMLSLLAGSAEEETDEENPEQENETDKIPETVSLRDFAKVEETESLPSISRENMAHYLTVTAELEPGYNTTLLSRELEPKINAYEETLPGGYTISFGGETTQISDMLSQMSRMLMLALLFIYLVMVAQFQSLLSPFIVLFTIPLAFTGGMLGLLITRQHLTLLSLMGFLVLMGTVVNNGIVFVDYANQLRIGGMQRRDALIATGKTRMRPILMTALTTILAMTQLLFGNGMGSQIGSGMAVVITGGLAYATLMTLYIVPVIYDLFFRKPPLSVDVGDDLDDAPDDAAEFIAQLKSNKTDS